jgi:lipoyl(octanoyl) transferase
VWVKNESIAAIGLSIKRWVSMHGFSINLNTTLDNFSLINPCGLTDRKVTSVSRLLDRHIPMEAVTEKLLDRFSGIFKIGIELRTESGLAGIYLEH